MTALFSTSQHSKNQTSPQNSVEFRAGKMTYDGKIVTADKRKGLVKFHFNADNLLQLTWTDRSTNVVEDDLLIMHDEVEFVKIPQCTTGRVFLLKWKYHSRRLFYWMQEPNTSKDESIFKRVSELVTNPKPTVSNSTSQRRSDFLDSLSSLQGVSGNNQDIYDMFRNISSQDLHQILQGARSVVNSNRNDAEEIVDYSQQQPQPQPTIQVIEQANETPANDSLDSYRKILREAIRIATTGQPNTQDQGVSDRKVLVPNISRALSWKFVRSFFDKYPNALDSLIPFLPEGRPQTREEVVESLQSPQVCQARGLLSCVIKYGQFATIAKQFDLYDEATMNEALAKGDFCEFCSALEKMLMKESGDDLIEDTNMEDLD